MFGNLYEDSGSYFKIKIIVNFFNIISYIGLIMAINANKFYANVHLIHALVLIVLEYISIKTFNSPYLITGISVFCRIGNTIVMLSYISKYFNVRFLDLFPIKTILKIVIPSIFILYPIKMLFENYLTMNGVIMLSLSFISYCVLFYFWALYSKIDYISIVKPLLLRFKK
jgi:hypothetical protein